MTVRDRSTFRKILLGFALLLVAVCAVPPVAALTVEGAKIMVDVVPGITYDFPMAISLNPTDPASDYAIDVRGFGQSVTAGSYTPLSASDDTSPYSARSFITMDSSLVHLDPGQRKEFNATMKVPQNIGDGGRYAVILIHPATIATDKFSLVTAFIVPVMLTINNTKLVETGTISDVGVGDIVAGQPITVSSVLKNTGNHHYYRVINQITVTDSAGKTVGTVKAKPVTFAIIPGQSVRFDTPVGVSLPLGTYTIKSDMLLESGTVLDSKSANLTVKETYIPPVQRSNITIRPNQPATLEEPEGTVRINFPQGAVFAETTVTVNPFTDTLPALPAGDRAGSTVFSIDGLSGFLAKNATITVKYSKADLTAANNDPSALVLGRYDGPDAQWTLLPTTVDQNAMTLTASSNRFSIWAVIAVPAGQQPSAAESTAGTQPPAKTTPPVETTKSPSPQPLFIVGLLGLFIVAWRIWNK